MPHKQRLGGEGVGLDVHIRSCHLEQTTGSDFYTLSEQTRLSRTASRLSAVRRDPTTPHVTRLLRASTDQAAPLSLRKWVLHQCGDSTNLIDEAGLANVGVPTQKQGPRVRVNGGQTGQMLTHCEKAKVNVLNFMKKHKQLKADGLLNLAVHSRPVAMLSHSNNDHTRDEKT